MNWKQVDDVGQMKMYLGCLFVLGARTWLLAEGNVCSLRNGGEQGVGVASEINTADGWRRETLSEGWGKGGGSPLSSSSEVLVS